MRRKKVVIIVAFIAVAALLLKGKSLLRERQQQVAAQPLPVVNIVTVPVVMPQRGVMHQEIAFLSQVLSDKHITLSTKLAGYVKEILVEEAQKVHKGEPLVRIDETELRSSIDALNATQRAQKNDLLLAESIYNRNVKLYRIGGLSREQLDLSRVALHMKRSVVENSRQKLLQLKHQLTYLQIVAPFDGEIDAVLLHEGDLAAAGKPILRMSNGAQKLLFSYAPTQKQMIAKGQMVVSGRRKVGEIRAIYATANNGLITAEVALDAPVGLPVGSTLPIKVLTESAHGCIVPDTTLVHKKEGTFVMVYDAGRFKPVHVDVKMHTENRVLLEQCPEGKIASASEAKLASLPAYADVEIVGEKDE